MDFAASDIFSQSIRIGTFHVIDSTILIMALSSRARSRSIERLFRVQNALGEAIRPR